MLCSCRCRRNILWGKALGWAKSACEGFHLFHSCFSTNWNRRNCRGIRLSTLCCHKDRYPWWLLESSAPPDTKILSVLILQEQVTVLFNYLDFANQTDWIQFCTRSIKQKDFNSMVSCGICCSKTPHIFF